MSFDSKSRQMILKEESTRGTYNAPDASTDFNIEVYELDDISFDAGHDGGMNKADGTFIMSKSYAGKKQNSYSWQTELKWSGDALVAPKWWLALRACGWTQTVDGVNPAKIEWTGRPQCTSLSADVYKWQCGSDPVGYKNIIAGIAGTVSLACEGVGQKVMASFTFTGKSGGRADVASGFTLPSGEDGTDAEIYLGATYTKGTAVLDVWDWSADMAGDVQPVDKSNDITNTVKTGIDYFAVKGAEPTGQITTTAVDLATIDHVKDMFDNVVDGTNVIALEHLKITLEAVQNTGVDESNNNETATDQVALKISKITIEQVA